MEMYKKYTHFIITIDVINGLSYKSTKMSLSDPNIDIEFMKILTENPNSLGKLVIIPEDSNNKMITFNKNVLNNSVISVEFFITKKITSKKIKELNEPTS